MSAIKKDSLLLWAVLFIFLWYIISYAVSFSKYKYR